MSARPAVEPFVVPHTSMRYRAPQISGACSAQYYSKVISDHAKVAGAVSNRSASNMQYAEHLTTAHWRENARATCTRENATNSCTYNGGGGESRPPLSSTPFYGHSSHLTRMGRMRTDVTHSYKCMLGGTNTQHGAPSGRPPGRAKWPDEGQHVIVDYCLMLRCGEFAALMEHDRFCARCS